MTEEIKPEVTFEDLHLHPNLLKGIHSLGFIRPTPVQAQAIPLVMSGRDVIGCAQTGTGKTAAFVLPILHRLLEGKSGKHLRALIIAPTRELAMQSMDHLKLLSKFVHLKGAAIFGGVPMNPQISALENGVDIVSATPGRLLDHIYNGRIDFADLEVLVLDEADRMLDMGFIPDIRNIIRLLPPKRQNLLFSATMPKEILALAHEFLHEPAMVQIGLRSAPAVGVRQSIYPVARHLKTALLLELLRADEMDAVLVFSRTKRGADRIAHELLRQGVSVCLIHGDRSQNDRLDAMDRFRYGDVQVMVATDVAARGLDIEHITHVVNYDVPDVPEDYVHRIGRTGRAQASGDALTVMTAEDATHVFAIERFITRTIERVKLENFPYQYSTVFDEVKPGQPALHERRARGARLSGGGYYYGPAKRRRR